GGAGSSVGTGGMLTKILAAKRAARSGATTVIACGREANVLSRLADGEAIGTQLVAQNDRWAARKQWLADHLRLAGRLVLDDGAARAVTARHTSLLPIGVIAVEGEFLRGDAVACVNSDGREVARGLANYSSDEARMIMRHPTRDIERLLGYVGEPELIHRDNLVNL
ncbi:glutamate 5-kinase, partial [Laribacter hongkongensis]